MPLHCTAQLASLTSLTWSAWCAQLKGQMTVEPSVIDEGGWFAAPNKLIKFMSERMKRTGSLKD